jgi:hypothetical protein
MFNIQLPIIYRDSVNLSTEASAAQASQALCNLVMPMIERIREAMLANTFAYDPWTFERNPTSGLTNQLGLYLIVNRRSFLRGIYLGSSINLALRKADYNRNFNEPDRLYQSMIPDLNEHRRDSFYFIPLIVFNIDQVIPDDTVQPVNVDDQVRRFFDEKVEASMLRFYLSDACAYREMFYNVSIVGRFQPGNNFIIAVHQLLGLHRRP